MLWDPITRIATFDIDKNYAGGAFVSDFSFTLDGSDNGFNSTNSQLLLGGGWGVSFDDISVAIIPEPSTLVLLVLGLISLAAYARKRRN
jgi:hypothetical protein